MKKAFTLTELLIALAIIGVILIITVPIVVSKMNSKAQTAALNANYSSMTNAIKLLMIDERASSVRKTSLYRASSTGSLEDSAGAFLKKYFKVVEDCETSSGDCFATKYKTVTGDAVTLPDEDMYCAAISTGASICLKPNTGDYPGAVLVDVNGADKPNVLGQDLFNYFIYSNGYVGLYGSSTSDNSIENILNADLMLGSSDDPSADEDPTIDDETE